MTAPTSGPGRRTWLGIIDMQRVFADPSSEWFAPRFAQIVEPVLTLAATLSPHVVLTRFLAPAVPTGAWRSYYRRWPRQLLPSAAPDWELVDALADLPGPRVDATTFGKWTDGLAALVGTEDVLVLAGVSTDCCVLSTALAAADAGVEVWVVADACAGADDAAHDRALATMALYSPLIEVIGLDDIPGIEA